MDLACRNEQADPGHRAIGRHRDDPGEAIGSFGELLRSPG